MSTTILFDTLATKQDIIDLRRDIKDLRVHVDAVEERLLSKVSIRLGSMIAIAVAVLGLLMKL